MEPSGGEGVRLGMRPVLGILLKVVSVTIFVGMSTMIKSAEGVPPGQIVFFRSAFAMIPILIFLMFRGQLATAFRTERPLNHIVRGSVGVTGMMLSFYALTLLPLPEAIMLNYAQPLLVVAVSALIVGETVRLYRWSAVIVGLLGVIVIVWPRLTILSEGGALEDSQTIGVAAALCAAFVSAFAVLLVRRLVATERSATIVLWFSLTASIVGLATIPFGWVALTQTQAILLVSAGFAGGIGQILMTECYRHADMSTIAPFEYTSMVLGIASGYFVFGELPTATTVIGGLIVVAAGIFIIWREASLGLDRGKARKLTPPQ